MAVNKFPILHAYRRLARRGLVKPLTCSNCQSEYTLAIDKDDEPMLRCFQCDINVHLGGYVMKQIEAVVKEHDLSV